MSEAAVPHGSRLGPGAARLLSDDRLARRASEGDRRAFEAIYNRYNQRLYRFCMAIVGNSQDAQDALQNTMVKVLRALPGERREIRLKPWLYRIAHNESVELVRRRRAAEQLDPGLTGHDSGPAEEAALRERLRLLLADLEELPERQRATLVMRELAGLDFAEIGAALDTSPATARQALYEARLSLHQMDAGREMSCATVTKALSDADGRIVRRRDIRAHLRTCESCSRFRDELKERRGDFAALSPLPAAAAAALLNGVLGGSGGSAGGGLAAAVGGGAAKAAGTSIAVKSAATVAVVAAVGFSATRGDLVEVGPLGGGDAGPGRPRAHSENGAPLPPAPRSVGERVARSQVGAAAVGIAERRDLDGRRAASRGGDSPPAAQVGQTSPEASPTPVDAPLRGQGKAKAGKEPPPAAAHGQQTAATHKKGAASQSGGRDHGKAHPAHPSKPSQPTKPPKTAPGKPASGSSPEPQGKAPATPPPASEEQPGQPEESPPGTGGKSPG